MERERDKKSNRMFPGFWSELPTGERKGVWRRRGSYLDMSFRILWDT